MDRIAAALRAGLAGLRPGAADPIPADLADAILTLIAAHRDEIERLDAERLRLQTELKIAQSRSEAIGNELKATRRTLRARDAEIAVMRRSLGWILARTIRGVGRVVSGKLGLRPAVIYGLRIVYHRLPLSEVTRRRVGEQGLTLVRQLRSMKPRRRPAPSPLQPRPQRTALAFPLSGSIAALPELAGASDVPPLDAAVSVVIPTYNAGSEFHWLLRKLRAQKGLRAVEIVVVDSGSTDGTVERAREAGCKIVQIRQSEFSHSYSRNLGAEHASGDLLLFMVQDAYPIGDYWLHTLAKCLREPRSESERLAAVSCAEFPRTDSELLYNALIDTHYRFLGCHDGDRVGRLTETDNLSLRREGQLSDVACLIERSTFDRYMYHGRYAEDLILGIRLIRDGHQVGMLSSVKVVHSHRRPVSYYVRRVFVDVVFLTDVFPDFTAPEATSIVGTFVAASVLQDHLKPIEPNPGTGAADALEEVIAALRAIKLPIAVIEPGKGVSFGFGPLGEWIDRVMKESGPVGHPLSPDDLRCAERVRTMFIDRLTSLKSYLAASAPVLDATTAGELNAAIEKTLAMTVGTQLAFLYLTADLGADQSRNPHLAELKPLLLAGI